MGTGGSLFTGTLKMLVLLAVRQEPAHGYAIGLWIRTQSAGALEVEEGQLYPALHRLEREGLLRSDWGETETGRRAKFYRLTATGRRRLASDADSWRSYSSAVTHLLDLPPS